MKFIKGVNMAQKIKPKQSIDGALRRQFMARNQQFTNRLTETFYKWNCDHREIFQSTGTDDGNAPPRLCWIATDGDRDLGRNYRGCGAGIDDHPNYLAAPKPLQITLSYKQRDRRAVYLNRHALKHYGITGWEVIIRVCNHCQTFGVNHGFVYFITIGTVGQQTPQFDGCCRAVHLVNADQQPLTMKTLPDFAYFFALHFEIILAIKILTGNDFHRNGGRKSNV